MSRRRKINNCKATKRKSAFMVRRHPLPFIIRTAMLNHITHRAKSAFSNTWIGRNIYYACYSTHTVIPSISMINFRNRLILKRLSLKLGIVCSCSISDCWSINVVSQFINVNLPHRSVQVFDHKWPS